MKYVGWMYNDDTGASGSAVQDDDENTIAWFENADDAIAYVKMASDLAVAIKRAEAAEELAESYAVTNEAQRKCIDELLEKLAQSNRRAEAAEKHL